MIGLFTAKRVFNATWVVSMALLFWAAATHAVDVPQPQPGPEPSNHVLSALLNCALFGILGIFLVTFGFKIFDWIITKIDLEKEIANGNVAASILSAGAILGISIIVATAIH